MLVQKDHLAVDLLFRMKCLVSSIELLNIERL